MLEEQPTGNRASPISRGPLYQVSGHLDAARASQYLGDLEAAKEHSASSLTLAEKLGDRVFLELTLGAYETVCRFEGVFQIAREFSDRGWPSLELLPDTVPIPLFLQCQTRSC